MRADYAELAKTIRALTEGETDAVALMATVVCELHHADDLTILVITRQG